MARTQEPSHQSVPSIEEEVRAATGMADYEAVDVLWLALLKLANRFSGTNEHHRMLALVDTIAVEKIGSILRLCRPAIMEADRRQLAWKRP